VVRVRTLKKKNGENMKRETTEDKMKGKLSRCPSILKHNDTKEYDGVEECEQFHAFLISAVDGGA
jgi:hypothetical protein